MKKYLVILVLALFSIGFGINGMDDGTVKGRPVNAKLCNTEHGQRLELYTDGRCKVIVNGASGWGNYTLNSTRTRITINWDNEQENRGDISVTRNGYVEFVNIEGLRYNTCK